MFFHTVGVPGNLIYFFGGGNCLPFEIELEKSGIPIWTALLTRYTDRLISLNNFFYSTQFQKDILVSINTFLYLSSASFLTLI